jgi:hypothetical protein
MGLRFARRVSLLTGLSVNLSKSGAATGARGSWLTVGPRGRRVTVDTPIPGLYYTERLLPAHTARAGRALAVAIVVVALVAAMWWLASA